MKLIRGEYFSTVTVSRHEVEEFRRQWPCSGLPAQAMWFRFTTNGDLVDMSFNHHDEEGGAMGALIQDAREYAGWRASCSGGTH